MKIYWMISAILVLTASACKKGKDAPPPEEAPVNTIITPGNEPGYVYIDGKYSGYKSNGQVKLPAGRHNIGVALENSWIYLRKEVDVTAGAAITFTAADKPAPKVWKALYVGLSETRGNSATGDCSTHFTKAELDAGYEFLQWSLREHFEKYSYGLMQWQLERKDIAEPVMLKKNGEAWYTVEPPVITAKIPEIVPGAYDCVFVFWRESEGTCSFRSNYFGLAWTNPMGEPIKTGFVTVKFDAGNGVAGRIANYKANDPGVWVHEWLHTTGERFYQDKGISMPQPAGGFTVHAAETYGYTYPWMTWYRDMMGGRVPNTLTGLGYLGIGPEAFLRCTVRETALDAACR